MPPEAVPIAAGPEGMVVGCLALGLAFDISAEQAKKKIERIGR